MVGPGTSGNQDHPCYK